MSAEQYRKLKAMSENAAASESERAMARKLMERLLASHAVDQLEHMVWRMKPTSEFTQQLVMNIASKFGARLDQENGTFIISGSVEVVGRVERAFLAYAPKLDEMTQMLLLAALKGWDVFCPEPSKGVRPKAGSPPPETFPPHVERQLIEFLRASAVLARAVAIRDESVKQLPAPKGWRERPDPSRFLRMLMGGSIA